MAARKKRKKNMRRRAPRSDGTPGGHGDVAGRGARLAAMREKRGRAPGDGRGVDIGISPGAFVALERHLEKLPEQTKRRLLDHVRNHVDEALKPMVKLVEKKGTEHELLLLRDVGPNMLRTVIEFLEEEVD